MVANPSSIEVLIYGTVLNERLCQEVDAEKHECKIKVAGEVGRHVHVRLSCIQTSVVGPVYGLQSDDILLASERSRNYQHQYHLKPKEVILENPDDWILAGKVLLKIILFDFDNTCFGTLLDNYIEESDWVLEILPNCLEVVFDHDGDAAHDGYGEHDGIGEV